MSTTILLIEDEMRIARWTQTYIEKAGYTCLWASNGRDGLHMARRETPDLIVLDLLLPEIDGWTVCQQLREESDVPIIMLTAKVTERDIVNGLKMGADDYVTKPFRPAELIARIEAALRRAQGHLGPTDHLTVGEISLNLESHQCVVDDEHVSLTAMQFELLRFFMQHPRQVLSRDQLIDNVFGLEFDSDTRAIDIHIRRLRLKIERDPSKPTRIKTVFGVGYQFCPE